MENKNGLFDKIITYIVLTFASLTILLPILWIIRTSMANRRIAYKIPPQWVFDPTIENYVAIFKDLNFLHFFMNSLIISLLSSLIAVMLAAVAAYSIARFKTGGTSLNVFILSTYMLPPIILIIPLFILVKSLGLLDTRLAVIIAYAGIHLPLLIWMMIGFFQGIPEALDESAMVDGCTRFQAFTKVILPVTAPGVIASFVMSFILAWNEFIIALIITGKTSRTLSVALSTLSTHQGVKIAELSAAIVLTILPIIALSFFIQRYLVYGLTFGAVK